MWIRLNSKEEMDIMNKFFNFFKIETDLPIWIENVSFVCFDTNSKECSMIFKSDSITMEQYFNKFKPKYGMKHNRFIHHIIGSYYHLAKEGCSFLTVMSNFEFSVSKSDKKVKVKLLC